MIRIGRKILKLLLIFFMMIVAAVIIWAFANKLITVAEKKNTLPIGQMITVDEKQMSIYTKGEGKHTIILMSGLGTTAPILDFEPIIDKLAETNKVVVVEPFGYGWSDLTDRERSVENIISELRDALEAAHIPGPYILMPHSISGIYATYYAETYPDEVSAIIGIDCTLPSQFQYFEQDKYTGVPNVAKLVCPLGISRLVTLISPEMFISQNINGEYEDENLQMQKKISAWKGYNSTVINEANAINSNIEKTIDMSFDSDLPLLFFTIREQSDKKRDDGKTSTSFYETYITNDSCQKVIEMDGKHYLHWNCSEDMCEEVNNFINNILNKSKE